MKSRGEKKCEPRRRRNLSLAAMTPRMIAIDIWPAPMNPIVWAAAAVTAEDVEAGLLMALFVDGRRKQEI